MKVRVLEWRANGSGRVEFVTSGPDWVERLGYETLDDAQFDGWKPLAFIDSKGMHGFPQVVLVHEGLRPTLPHASYAGMDVKPEAMPS